MRSPIAVVIVGVFVALAGCGGGTSAGGSSRSRSASGGAAALEVTFRTVTPGSDSAAMVDYDAVLQGGKVRLTTIGYAMDAKAAGTAAPREQTSAARAERVNRSDPGLGLELDQRLVGAAGRSEVPHGPGLAGGGVCCGAAEAGG